MPARNTDDCVLVDEFGRQHVCLLGFRFSVKVHVAAISQRVHNPSLALREQSACLIVHHAEAGLHRETAAHQIAGGIHIRMTAASHICSELHGFGGRGPWDRIGDAGLKVKTLFQGCCHRQGDEGVPR